MRVGWFYFLFYLVLSLRFSNNRLVEVVVYFEGGLESFVRGDRGYWGLREFV